jgi:arginine decarboxylase
MIHIHDQDFEHGARTVFNEAYMTHTSTSPNLQIVGSLDVGRRQVELEGFDLVQRSVELAMLLRERIRADPLLQKYCRVLGPEEMVPEEHRQSGITAFYDADKGWADLSKPWIEDEFVLDPTRVTVDIGRTGMDGDQFKKMLMDRFDIQVNKTSRNTVLFMTHIGMTRGMIAHLVKVLTQIAEEIEEREGEASAMERRQFQQRVHRLVDELPPLPNFSSFHPAFVPHPSPGTRDGDMRSAFFLAYKDPACEYLALDGAVSSEMAAGREVVSASFVTPYPPGFPVLVPGQIITEEILAYLKALDVKEIHGYEPAYGLRVFRQDVLDQRTRAERPATEKTSA